MAAGKQNMGQLFKVLAMYWSHTHTSFRGNGFETVEPISSFPCSGSSCSTDSSLPVVYARVYMFGNETGGECLGMRP